MSLTREQMLAALRSVQDPELFKDIVTLDRVRGIKIEGNDVTVTIEMKSLSGPITERIAKDAAKALQGAGAKDVKVELIAPDPDAGAPVHQAGATATKAVAPGGAPAGAPKKDLLPQVKNVVAVGAGKGGVGKSTIAVNLAVGLQRAGFAVGLMDGDIYGPSMPTMLGIKGVAPEVLGSKIRPHFVHGIHAITIGSLVEQDKPLIWRGPMAHGAFKQLLLDNTQWPELDYLIVDLPPGTGDVPLTLCQLLPITGAVVVATPQQVALDDAVRAVRMFQQLQTPVLGIVENMSYFVGADGNIHDIFGRGGAQVAAKQLGLPFLGAVPMFTSLRVNSDAGTPIKNFEENPLLAESLTRLVQNLCAQIALRKLEGAAPQLNIT